MIWSDDTDVASSVSRATVLALTAATWLVVFAVEAR